MDKLEPVATQVTQTYEVECPHGCVEPAYLIVTLRTDSILATPTKFKLTHQAPNE